jgi:hypothetical protein
MDSSAETENNIQYMQMKFIDPICLGYDINSIFIEKRLP